MEIAHPGQKLSKGFQGGIKMWFFRRRKPLKSFEEERPKNTAFNMRYVGVTPIEVDKIVGSVDRYEDFDADFQWLNGRPDDRSKRLVEAMERGEIVPPIEVYQLNDKYFVLDGHHRVGAAKKVGQDFLDASVTRIVV